jgi:hypothetical protein
VSKPSTPTVLKSAGCVAGLFLVAAAAMIAFGTGSQGKITKATLQPALTKPATPAASSPANDQQRSRVRAAMGALPLAFEANQGQIDPQVKYMARGNGYTLFLTNDDAVFAVHSPSASANAAGKFRPAKSGPRKEHAGARSEEKSAAIHMRLVGGNSGPQIAAGSELPGRINYYTGNDRTNWHEGVKQYSAVTYREVYPGVNLAYHGQRPQLEFDFVVSPGASAAPIDLGFKGASKIATDAAGNLVLSSAAGNVLLHKPVAYQEKDGQRQLVDASFRKSGANQVGFVVGAYDHSRELVIDPTLSFASYLGGSADDEAYAIALDGSGDIYVTGETNSPTFGGQSAGPNFDVFVSEFDTTASSLVYTSIFSGTGDCSGNAIAVDASNDAYIGGSATSGFPTTGGHQTTFGGGTLDGFVTKLASSTGTLLYSTYLGGNGRDVVNGIAIDKASPPNVYVAGDTFSTNFPGTGSSTIQSSLTGTDDNAFVAELNGTTTAVTYSTYLGGSSFNLATAIALDSSNNAYITGLTGSSDFPVIPASGALQGTLGGGGQDGFVAEINAAGSALVYSTYLGGSGVDAGAAIAVDAAGEAYVTGSTASSNFPTQNAAQTALGGGSATNAFVTKLNAGGTALVFSTYYGGNEDDAGTDIALDGFGDAFITGRATSSNYPVSNGFQSTLSGSSDAIVTEFSNTGFVEYSSFLGGPGTENGVGGLDAQGAIGGIAVDSSNNVYLAGDTSSTSNLATTGAYQTAYGHGAADAFVAKVGPAAADFSVAASPGSVSVSSGQTTSAIAVTVASVNSSFGQAVTLSCGSLPAHASCQFTSASVTPGGASSPGTSSVTISTSASSSASLLAPGANRHMQIFAAIVAPLFGIALIGGGVGSRKKRACGLLLLALVLIGIMALPACGGSSNNGGGGGGGTTTPAGTYNITVIGSAGGTTHSAPVALTVN